MASVNPPRKFAPIPIEHSTKTSRQRSPPKDDKPEARRFAPQLVETTSSTSSHARPHQAEVDPNPKPRRFAPQIVEESHKSSSDRKNNRSGDARPHIRFDVDPVSAVDSSSPEQRTDGNDDVANPQYPPKSEKKAPRKFAPILLDTARRSRRAGSGSESLAGDDRTESGFDLHAQEHRRHIAGNITSTASSEAGSDHPRKWPVSSRSLVDSEEIRSRMTPADRKISMASRTHSFRMPELDTIESSESERDESDPCSLSSSVEQGGPPFIPSGSDHEFYKHATRIRESFDENFTHYLLELERKKAQQRLEEQALAAFPNPDFGYEPPHHYVNNDDDSDEMEIEDRPVTFDEEEGELMDIVRRESAAPDSWEQRELQRHAEELQQERKANEPSARKESSKSPWWRPGAFADVQEPPDQELKSMRDRARPPMLGEDLVFPRCPSPEPARFDVTQSRATLRNQVCGHIDTTNDGDHEGLWSAPHSPQSPQLSRVTTTKSTTSSAGKHAEAKGLWGGFCLDDSRPGTPSGLKPPTGPTGLLTPQPEPSNQFDQPNPSIQTAHLNNTIQPDTLTAPQTPTFAIHSPADLSRIDSVLVTERDLDAHMAREFPDTFITQVYNYLSLGYPSLARPFDAELAKISRIPISDLRRDDLKARSSPRGYIRLGPDFEPPESPDAVEEEGCVRWHALKLYVREWARQENGMVNVAADEPTANWGTGARRGSWAW